MEIIFQRAAMAQITRKFPLVTCYLKFKIINIAKKACLCFTMSGRGGKSFKPKPKPHLNKSGGLSLAKFAGAKKSTYDPREVKERQRAKAAITVAKYKKLKAKLQRTSNILPGRQVRLICSFVIRNEGSLINLCIHSFFTGRRCRGSWCRA